MHTSRNIEVGIFAAGLAVLAGVLVAYGPRAAVLAATAIAVFLCVLGVWSLGVTYLGWRQPKTHEEKQAIRQAQEIEDIQRFWARHHAINELSDELERGGKALEAELRDQKMYGPGHENTAWTRHRDYMDGWGLEEEHTLAEEAHEHLKVIGDEKRERFNNKDENDLGPVRLFRRDRELRSAAIPVIEKAVEALRAAQRDAP